MTDKTGLGVPYKLPSDIVTEILRGEVGSTAHGVGLPGTDDLDLMAVAVERPESFLRVEEGFDHYLYRTAEEREGRGARSRAGDTDLMVHSLRRFSRLCAAGNPSILLLLYSPVLESNHWGKRLLENKQMFLSKTAGARFLGYLRAQKGRLLGERGGMDVKRQELIDAYGFDTKYAMHAIRLGYQGVTLVQNGFIPVPVAPTMRQYLINVRTGQVPLKEIIQKIEQLENDLGTTIPLSYLPDEADAAAISEFLCETYVGVWKHYNLI